MTEVGLFMMIFSNAVVVLLTVFCFYRVFSTPGTEKHEHAMLEIDTRDTDVPEQ